MKRTAVERGDKLAGAFFDDHVAPPTENMAVLTRRCIEKAGSIKALAEHLDITPSAPGNWARGVYNPSRKYRERMADYLSEDSAP